MKTTKERLATAIHTSLNETLSFYKTSLTGLTEEQVEKNRDLYGENTITKGQEDSILKKIYESIINPFTIIHMGGESHDLVKLKLNFLIPHTKE